MPTEISRGMIEVRYYQAAQDYLRKLPLEHFMEATPQSTQRKITVESFDLIHLRRSDIQLFSELLVQYQMPGRKRLSQVVPDNMVVLHPEPIVADTSYDVPLQPAGPFLVLEYVSKGSKRKDYNNNVRRYEQELKVPYYLIYLPDQEDLTLYRMVDDLYVSVRPDDHGHFAVPELEVEAAVMDGWLRFWFRGELVPLPTDLQLRLDEKDLRLTETEGRLTETEGRLTEAEGRLAKSERERLAAEEEIARLRALLEQRSTSSEVS